MKLFRKQSFILANSDIKQSRLRQKRFSGTGLDYTHFYDLFVQTAFNNVKKIVYTYDLTFLHSFGNWKNLEATLSQDISTLSACGIPQKNKFSLLAALLRETCGMRFWCFQASSQLNFVDYKRQSFWLLSFFKYFCFGFDKDLKIVILN